MRIAFFTLGCKVNQYETQHLKQLFQTEGFTIVQPEQPAEVYVINSCTVTAMGDKKTRQILHRLIKQNKRALIALTGCLPQAFPDKMDEFQQVQVITGAHNRQGLVAHVQQALQTGKRVIEILPHQKNQPFEPMENFEFSGKARALVKIQDGCERHCTYCIIPKARGPVRSKSLDNIRREISTLVQNGYQEVVLTGINLSSYGNDIGSCLVEAVTVSCGVDGIKRVRLGSLEPERLSQQEIQQLALLQPFCPQFHLSLQSGCDQTLKRMGRVYDTACYQMVVKHLRDQFKDCAITTDIMVGFPGETEEEFSKTLAFVQQMKFAQAHIFCYSKREGTPACNLPNQLSQAEKKHRSGLIQQVVKQSQRNYWASFVGKTVEVLFEQVGHESWAGHSKEFIPVEGRFPSQQGNSHMDAMVQPGVVLPVKIIGMSTQHCIGRCC